MKRRIFLSGPIGCGKSTLIRRALGGAIARAGGFVTARLVDDGELTGFELCPAAGGCGRRFLSFGENGAERDERVFTEYAPMLLREAGAAPFAVIDEVGGAELCQPEFFSALIHLLESSVPCVGVLKSPAAAEALRRRVGVPAGWERAYEEVRGAILSHGSGTILETTGRGDAAAEKALNDWVRDYVGSL